MLNVLKPHFSEYNYTSANFFFINKQISSSVKRIQVHLTSAFIFLVVLHNIHAVNESFYSHDYLELLEILKFFRMS